MAEGNPPNLPGSGEPGIAFAGELDAARYRVLKARLQELEAQVAAVEGEIAAILRRARWSLGSILDREG